MTSASIADFVEEIRLLFTGGNNQMRGMKIPARRRLCSCEESEAL
jgi:hypothetical protein